MSTFNYFFHGSPVILPDSKTNAFGYWFHGTPTVVPAIGIIPATVQTFTMKAWIAIPNLKTLDMRAFIFARTLQLFEMRASIFDPTGKTFLMQARLSRRQGWPIPDSDDPGLYLFTDTRLYTRAFISGPSLGSNLLRMKAKIRLGGNFGIQLGAFITLAGKFSMRGRISGKTSQSVVMTYDVQKTSLVKAVMQFVTPGIVTG